MTNLLPVEKQRAVVRSVWGQYRAWAAGARATKGGYEGLRWAVLVLTVAAMIAGPFAKSVEQWSPGAAKALVIAASALFALLAWMNKSVMGDDSQEPWVRKRELAEALKSLAFQFLGGVAPYDKADAGEAALERASGLASKSVGAMPQLTEEEAAKSMPAIPLTGESYVKERVIDQVNYYRKNAAAEEATANNVRLFGWAVGGLVVVGGAVSAALGNSLIDIWMPALSLTATAITTQVALGRRRFLSETYSAAAAKLDLARARWEISDRQPADLQQLVSRAEAILVGENAAWVEQLLSTPAPSGPPKPAEQT